MGWRSVLVVAVVMAGCASPAAPAPEAPEAWRAQSCVHPWPCGDGSEWPLDLATPEEGFGFEEWPVQVRIPMDDGIEIDGAVWMPGVPEGVRVPVVIWATPYAGQCRYSGFVGAVDPSDPADVSPPTCDEVPWLANDMGNSVFQFLVREGYAAAMVSFRGTGHSGGCFDYYGARSQLDMSAIAQWFGDQPWSNGRVAMWGVSAMGTAPFMAAIGAPPALKTIAPSGIISDFYLNRFTPQGAPDLTGASFHAGWSSFNSVVPPGGVYEDPLQLPTTGPATVESASTRYCEDLPATILAGAAAQHTDDRDAAFWEERRLVARFPDITASVLVLQGFQDYGHAFQDDIVWGALPQAPKRMLAGPWGHTAFAGDAVESYAGGNMTTTIYVEWFDFWLKGIGGPPRLGQVDLSSTDGSWRESTAWPPPEAREELLYLAGGALSARPGADGTFRASPAANPPACGYGVDPPDEGALIFESAGLERATVAGNPYAYLELTSDDPGGAFALSVYDVDASGACAGLVSEGGADLRFHQGNMVGVDFPTGTPTPVRVDLFGTAYTIEDGHRLRVVLSMGESGTVSQPQHAPVLTIGGESHLVLPLVEGSVGGNAPTMEYPPRPFTPLS